MTSFREYIVLISLFAFSFLTVAANEVGVAYFDKSELKSYNLKVITSAKVEKAKDVYGWVLEPGNKEASMLRCFVDNNVMYNIKPGVEVVVEVKYLDKGFGGFCISYNSRKCMRQGEFVQLEDSENWKTHTFTLCDAVFNDGIEDCDFLITSNDRVVMGKSTTNVTISDIHIVKSKYIAPYDVCVKSKRFGNVFFENDDIVFNMRFDDIANNKDVHPVNISVKDYSGKTIYSVKKNTKIEKLCLPQLPFGVYELCVDVNDDVVNQQKTVDFSFSRQSKITNWRFGTNVHYDWYVYDDEAIAGISDLVKNAGYGFVRTSHRWNEMEKEKGKYELTHNIEYANKYLSSIGLEMLAIITPENYLYDNRPFNLDSKEKREAYCNFCKFLVGSLKGYTRYFNSPNERNLLTGGKHVPESYKYFFNVVRDAYPVIKAANPDAFIISGELGGYRKEYNQNLFNLGIMKYCDAYSMHIYEFIAGPETYYANYPDLNIYPLTHEFYKEVKAAGSNKGAWITESGWPSRKTNFEDITLRKQFWVCSELEQARWYARSFMINSDPSYIDKLFHYCFVDNQVGYFYYENQFGIIHSYDYRTPFAAKPAYLTSAAFNSIVGDAEFKEDSADQDKKRDDKKRFAFRFVNKSGDEIMCYWQKDDRFIQDKKPVEYVYKCNKKYLHIYDMYGNKKTVKNDTGTYVGTYKCEPVYIIGSNSK